MRSYILVIDEKVKALKNHCLLGRKPLFKNRSDLTIVLIHEPEIVEESGSSFSKFFKYTKITKS